MYRALCGSLCSCRAGEEHVPQHFLVSRNLLILSLRVTAMPPCTLSRFLLDLRCGMTSSKFTTEKQVVLAQSCGLPLTSAQSARFFQAIE